MPVPQASRPLVDVMIRVADLPQDVAEQVEQVQQESPEILRKILMYGMTRRAIFEALAARGEGPQG